MCSSDLINICLNLGQDVIYFGTVGAAREGALKGIPSLAVSAAEMYVQDYAHSAAAVREIAEKILKRKKYFKGICFNVNIPRNYRGVKLVFLGLRAYDENVETVADGKGNFSYRLSGRYVSGGENKGSDIDTVKRDYISVTPLILDQTNFELLKKIADDEGGDEGGGDVGDEVHEVADGVGVGGDGGHDVE